MAEATKTLAPPPVKKKSPPPRAEEWEMRLRELPREWKLMLEDFGFTKTTLARYADQAKRGEKKAIDKIEPLKQFFFTLMGLTKHNRIVRHEEGELVGKPVMEEVNGELQPKKEERSVYGLRQGYDLVTDAKARKPRPGGIRSKVDEHFYDLVVLLEFLKTSAPVKLPDGRAHPNPELLAKAFENVAGGGTVASKVFALTPQEIGAEFDRVINNTSDPARRESLELLKEHMVKGKKSDWTGED